MSLVAHSLLELDAAEGWPDAAAALVFGEQDTNGDPRTDAALDAGVQRADAYNKDAVRHADRGDERSRKLSVLGIQHYLSAMIFDLICMVPSRSR